MQHYVLAGLCAGRPLRGGVLPRWDLPARSSSGCTGSPRISTSCSRSRTPVSLEALPRLGRATCAAGRHPLRAGRTAPSSPGPSRRPSSRPTRLARSCCSICRSAATQARKIRVKLEIDTNPPAGSTFQTAFISFPVTAAITSQSLKSGFGTKSHALLCRSTSRAATGTTCSGTSPARRSLICACCRTPSTSRDPGQASGRRSPRVVSRAMRPRRRGGLGGCQRRRDALRARAGPRGRRPLDPRPVLLRLNRLAQYLYSSAARWRERHASSKSPWSSWLERPVKDRQVVARLAPDVPGIEESESPASGTGTASRRRRPPAGNGSRRTHKQKGAPRHGTDRSED